MPQTAFVFVSQPTTLSARQQQAQTLIMDELAVLGLAPRTVGVSDFATKNPLHEVCVLARHCSGGLVLGFRQAVAERVVLKPDTARETVVESACYPSPWNQLEAGVLFALRVPLLVLCEAGIGGGVFDPGAGDHYINRLDLERLDDPVHVGELRHAIRSWSNDVWSHYRSVW